MMKKKLSKVARRRRVIVFAVEAVLVAAAMLLCGLLMGWVVSRLTGPLIELLDNAVKAVIG